MLPLTAEQVLSYVQDLPGLVAVDQDRAKALLRRFLAPVVLNPTDDGIEAAFQINVAGVLELVGAGTGVRYDSFGCRARDLNPTAGSLGATPICL